MTKLKRYNLTMPKVLYRCLGKIAEKRCTTIPEILKSGIKWVLLANSVKNNGGRILVEEKDGKSTEILLC